MLAAWRRERGCPMSDESSSQPGPQGPMGTENQQNPGVQEVHEVEEVRPAAPLPAAAQIPAAGEDEGAGPASCAAAPTVRQSRNAPRPLVNPAHLQDIATVRQFAGAPEAVAILEHALELALMQARRLEHVLITGPADCGKQVLARALARDYAQPAMEIDAAWIRSSRQLARALKRMEDRDALLLRRIDELHPASLRLLVSVMGMRTLRRDPESTKQLADITVIATASDRWHGAQRMRAACSGRGFALHLALPAPTIPARTAAAIRAMQALGAPPTPQARAVAERCVAHAAARGGRADPLVLARAYAAVGLGALERWCEDR